MSLPFIGEVRMWAVNYAPYGWAVCNGQVLPVDENPSAFSLLGITYGGNGHTTFGLPDLHGRTPMHWGSGPGLTERYLGEFGGNEFVSLSMTQMPRHKHQLYGDSQVPESATPSDTNMYGLLTESSSIPAYATAEDGTKAPMASGVLKSTGISRGHENRQPFLTLTFCIALMGHYPSRN